MIFLDLWFWAFVALAVPAYWLCADRVKLPVLVAISGAFWLYFAGVAGILPIAVLGVLTYWLGLTFAEEDSDARSRILFPVGIATLLFALAFYKYSDFAAASIANVLSALGGTAIVDAIKGWHSPATPLALSFFTFLFIHYLYEIRINGREPVRSPLRFTAFAVFFPSLAAGPLRRYPDFVSQLDSLRTPEREQIVRGLMRIVRGLFKKVCVADVLADVVKVLEVADHYTAPLVLLIAVTQGVRVYYDFAGYSDVAIGLAQTLGIKIPENFYRPFGSTSLAEFWRRWHMSLSFWIRDYVFVPLRGNAVIAMTLCGLWHGADWNFVLWGLYHGVGLTVEGRVRRRWPKLFHKGRGRTLLRRAIFLTFVTYSWLIFFYPPSVVYRMTIDSIRWCFAFGPSWG